MSFKGNLCVLHVFIFMRINDDDDDIVVIEYERGTHGGRVVGHIAAERASS